MLEPETVLYQIAKKWRREHGQGKRSLLQRILEKDEGASVLWCGIIAGINRLNTHVELLISDGHYCLKSQPLKRSNDPFNTNDDRVLALLDQNKLYTG